MNTEAQHFLTTKTLFWENTPLFSENGNFFASAIYQSLFGVLKSLSSSSGQIPHAKYLLVCEVGLESPMQR